MPEFVEERCLKKERKKRGTRKLEVYIANIMHFLQKWYCSIASIGQGKIYNAHFAENWYCSIASIDQKINSINFSPSVTQ